MGTILRPSTTLSWCRQGPRPRAPKPLRESRDGCRRNGPRLKPLPVNSAEFQQPEGCSLRITETNGQSESSHTDIRAGGLIPPF